MTEKIIKAAFGILITPAGKVILCVNKEKPLPKKWKNPGGKTETGEDGPTTLRRELAEEINLHDFQIVRAIKVEKTDHLVMFYVIKNVELKNLTKGPELENLQEFSRKKVEEFVAYGDILPCHAVALREVLQELPY